MKRNNHKRRGTTAPKQKTVREELVEDTEELLERVLIEEASAEIWKRFEQALGQFDEHNLKLFEDYLDGVTVEELSRRENIGTKELETWVKQQKRNLILRLHQGTKVRQ